ncbi:HAD-like domain-containing protein [Xylaria sp. FL1042]|nr:HAD-like domain-containing protein [Xylaria sp. FL1042]
MAPSYPDLTGFKALSFDCYGTLIDWETGMQKALQPLISDLPPSHPLKTTPPTAAMRRLDAIATSHQERTPTLPYNELLVMSLSDLAQENHIALPDSISEPFGNAVGTWGAFADTIPGLQKLARHYKLVILSNVDNANIGATISRQLDPARFDAVYTAQDIGSYKPARANFEYLFGHAKAGLGVDWTKGELLHVARSLSADHVPAKEVGLRSVWISRGGEKEGGEGVGGSLRELRDRVAFEWRFDTIGDFADEVERQFAAKKS